MPSINFDPSITWQLQKRKIIVVYEIIKLSPLTKPRLERKWLIDYTKNLNGFYKYIR